jgi:vancomycin permeability regulator SanA
LFLCKQFQINAVALNADPVVRRHSWRLTCREFAARAVAVLNVCLVPARPNGRKIKTTIWPKMTPRN